MAERLRPDICIIGTGSTGLSVAATASAFGVSTVLIERDRMGGECLNTGCVPSKALIAVGRRLVLEGLGLEAAGIAHDGKRRQLDARLRTTNRRVFAAGDVAGGPQFTHVASYHAGIVIRNALFRIPAKASYGHLPRVTYTDPPLAQVGLTEEEARQAGHRVKVLRSAYAENDRARADRATRGHIKVVVSDRGRILGIVGADADALVQVWAPALARRLGIRAMTELVDPYPNFGEISKRAAYEHYKPGLTNPWTRRILSALRLFG
ncbi:FAD-dependent oxidoreductase [Lutibaculum baratangense]|nr:FAD-dependent oxidoreductase [Lutibaculum baratangense]